MPIYGPESISLEGVRGDRYWYDAPFEFTGCEEIDARLSAFPVAVFLPPRCHPQTPLVIAIQGMCAPYTWNAFIIPTLTQMGFMVALFETPLAGERSLTRSFSANFLDEVHPFLQRGDLLNAQFLRNVFSCVARDIRIVRDLCCERYRLQDPRIVLFGVSMGVLQSAFAFTADGIGDCLLGVIGHADLKTFAASWGRPGLPELANSFLGSVAYKVLPRLSPKLEVIVPMLRLVNELKQNNNDSTLCNPMTYLDRVHPSRRVRFLVGDRDPLVNSADAKACAARFPDGDCYVVPGLGHGNNAFGPTFVEHVRHFLMTQLGQWP